MSQLAKWLRHEQVQYVDRVVDWKQAVQIAGRPLRDQGAISQDYIDAIIRQKEDVGPYFVIAPRIAMPHARPEEGANTLGLSVVKLQHAVEFDSAENDPVDVIFMFSAPDSHSHIEMISHLAEVLSDDDIMQRIYASRSQQQLIDLLLAGDTVSDSEQS